MSKTKFEQAAKEYQAIATDVSGGVAPYYVDSFIAGADFGYEYGKNEERERAEKLVKALKEIINRVDLNDINFDICQEAIEQYEGDI